MKAICPKDPTHKEFITTAHVMQDWKVDENGNFVEEVVTIQTTHGPNPDNYWNCAECGAEAIVTR